MVISRGLRNMNMGGRAIRQPAMIMKYLSLSSARSANEISEFCTQFL